MAEQDERKLEQVPQGDGTGDATGEQGTAAPNSGQHVVTFSEQQQAHIDHLIGERLKRAREQWKGEAEVSKAKAAEDAEAERLKAQQQFKELSEKQAAKLAELEGLQPELKRYKDALMVYAQKARAGLPEHVVPLLEKLDPVEQLAYLAEHGAAMAKPAGGVPATPGATGAEGLDDATRRKRAASIRRVW